MEPGAVTRLAERVNTPSITHEVSIGQLEKWLSGIARSPYETVLKARVRELLEAKAGSV